MLRLSESFEDTIRLGEEIGGRLQAGAVIALQGPLGCGKTALVKGIAKALDIPEEITSPSYTLISEYRGRLELFHMDFYRIDSPEEFRLLGIEEYLYGEGISAIEWAEKMEELLPLNRISLVFRLRENGSREIAINGIAV
jgi:tRNA threonylcarbamoyladenosine biosynthesis protein TsaE